MYNLSHLPCSPVLFINLRNEMFKYQEMQEPADKFEAGNSELFSNQI